MSIPPPITEIRVCTFLKGCRNCVLTISGSTRVGIRESYIQNFMNRFCVVYYSVEQTDFEPHEGRTNTLQLDIFFFQIVRQAVKNNE